MKKLYQTVCTVSIYILNIIYKIYFENKNEYFETKNKTVLLRTCTVIESAIGTFRGLYIILLVEQFLFLLPSPTYIWLTFFFSGKVIHFIECHVIFVDPDRDISCSIYLLPQKIVYCDKNIGKSVQKTIIIR